MTASIDPLPGRLRCTICPAEISRWVATTTPTTVDWLLYQGHWFCPGCRVHAPWVVLLDRERNAHQVTMFKLDAANGEIARLEAERSQAVTERCGAVIAADEMRAQCATLERMLGTDRDATGLRMRLRKANADRTALLALRAADRAEAAATYAALRAEIEALRCGDLGAYFDGELSTERRDAFDRHLATCEACAAGLLGLMQQGAITDGGCHG